MKPASNKRTPPALLLDNLRSAYNVGSIVRTAVHFGIPVIYVAGTTPYPSIPGDNRLPHVRRRLDRLIHKTALGAEQHVRFIPQPDPKMCIQTARKQGYAIYALEQHAQAIKLPLTPKISSPWLLIAGSELKGVSQPLLQFADYILEIPRFGPKESLNVSHAAAIGIYHLQCMQTRALIKQK